jgi:hypothetical protein
MARFPARVKVISLSIVKPTRCTNFSSLFCFGNNTLHVSDDLSFHHQEFKTVHTATGIYQTDTATCLLAGTRWNCTSGDKRNDRPKHVECYFKINKFEKLVHLVGFTIEIYYDELSYKRKKKILPFSKNSTTGIESHAAHSSMGTGHVSP